MYLNYFGLAERPFSIAPDPQYLYMSARHREAMAHLSYGLSQGGCFIVLTGEVGTGKTTLCRNLLADLPDNVDVALILNPTINRRELLETVCDELKIASPEGQSKKKLLDSINEHLLKTYAENRHTVLIIDEAQLLSRNVLEQVRLLTNLETTKSKLLQIILIGQPELNEVLSRNDLRQLSQRVTARYHLPAIGRDEIQDYVNFRLGVAGCKKPLFSAQALNLLHKLSEGIPRKINVLADHALLATYAKSELMVDTKTLRGSAKDVLVKPENTATAMGFQWLKSTWFKSPWFTLVVAFFAFNLSMWWWFSDRGYQTPLDDQPSQQLSTQLLEPSDENAGRDSAAQFGEEIDSQVAGAEIEPSLDSLDVDLVSEAQLAGDTLLTGDQSVSGEIKNDQATIDLSQLAGSSDVLASINKPDGVVPGSVVISDEFLDAETGPVVNSSASSLGADAGSVVFEQAAPVKATPKYLATSAFGRVLDVSSDRTGRIAAFVNLAAAWDANLPKSLLGPLCEELDVRGVACLPVSNWQAILRYNRPTIMVLQHDGSDHRIILYKLQDSIASVLVGEQSYELPIRELRDRWADNAMVFWRPSELGTQLLQLGDTQQTVRSLRIKLNEVFKKLSMSPLDNLDSMLFDAELVERVSELQRRFGILDDGKIGRETYLLINELLGGERVPVLVERG